MTKWPDRPHSEFAGTYLGADEHGDWIGFPEGSRFTRPGADYVAPYDQVGLVPPDQGWVAAFRTDQAQVSLVPRDEPFVATFYAPGGSAHCDVYVDITTVPVWSGDTVTAVDLDLDVVRGWTGRVWVDDEDEFAAHRVQHAYPPHLVRLAVGSCEAVRDAVRRAEAPYDGRTPGPWFEALAACTMGS